MSITAKFKCKDYHSFDEIAPTLKTGDIFLAHGDSPISHLIEDLTWSEWSHSGMVVLASDIGLTNLPTNILLWESTRSTELPDIVTGNYKNNQKYPGGTFLVNLRDRINLDVKSNEIPIAIRHLLPSCLMKVQIFCALIKKISYPLKLIIRISKFEFKTEKP